MLKGIPPLLNGELLRILRDMGHGDELAIVDANYPATSASAVSGRLVRLDAASATDVLAAVLALFPLDEFVSSPAFVMSPGGGRKAPVLAAFQSVLDAAHGTRVKVTALERFKFYDRARQAYAFVATGERRLYGNVIVKKGIVRPGE